jgi:hypothetical protein
MPDRNSTLSAALSSQLLDIARRHVRGGAWLARAYGRIAKPCGGNSGSFRATLIGIRTINAGRG